MTNNQLAENSVNQLLNSVRLARDNAERADNRVDHSFYYALTIALEELQERRKADSEPVATLDVQSRRPDGNKFALVFSSAAHKLPDDVYFLYRHAQPAPVVLPVQHWEELCRQNPDMSIGDAVIRAAWWNHCRAEILQAGNSPVIPDGLIAAVNRLLDSDGSRGCYSAIQCGDAHDEIERMLAAAPQEVKGEHQIRDEMDMGARLTSHRFKV